MLVSEAMPLIRYRTGDRSCFITSTCKCGSSLKRLGRIENRFEDAVSLAEGVSLHINQLDEQLFSLGPLRGYQAALILEGKSPLLYIIIDSIDRIDPAVFSSLLPSSIKVLIHYNYCDPYIFRGKRRLFRDLSHPIFSVFR